MAECLKTIEYPGRKAIAALSPVQVGQAVKALVLLGEKKITIEETEKDRFVVTTTTETARSKKVK